MRELHHRLEAIAAPNALNPAGDMYWSPGSRRRDILYVGRFVPAKKVALSVEAFASADLRAGIRLVLVGDGPERSPLIAAIESHALSDRVAMGDYADDLDTLRTYHSTAIITVSPGYVGLAAIQSFVFGVPMVVAAGEPHAPEIEAVRSGFNALLAPSTIRRSRPRCGTPSSVPPTTSHPAPTSPERAPLRTPSNA